MGAEPRTCYARDFRGSRLSSALLLVLVLVLAPKRLSKLLLVSKRLLLSTLLVRFSSS